MKRLAIASAVLAAGGALAMSPGAHATPDHLAGLKAQSITCSSGSTAIVPTSATTDALGVRHVHYKAFPSWEVAIPPAGFSAKTASKAMINDVRAHGSAAAHAEQVMASTGQAPSFCMTHTAPPAAKATPNSAPTLLNPSGHTWSTTWAAYVVNLSITGAQAFWTQSQSVADAPTPNSDLTFVGIGGSLEDQHNNPGNWDAIYAGTSMMSNNGYQAWWATDIAGPFDTTGNGITFSNGSVVRPGDDIEAEVWWQDPITPCFSVTDRTRSSGNFSGCDANAGIVYDHRSMEFVDLDVPPPTMHMGSFSQTSKGYLSDFAATQWNGGFAFDPATGRTVPFTSYTDEAYIMAASGSPVPPCSNGPMAYPGNLNLNNVTWNNIYCNSGPN